jgi:hypothetical protein
VEDVSNMNLRYRLIKEGSGSKPTTVEGQTFVAMFCTNETWLDALVHEK